jgi:hypothetical protein
LALGIVVASANSAAGYLNPSIALGSHVWSWGTYALGPVLGALIGVNLYSLLFAANVPVAAATAASRATVTKSRAATKTKAAVRTAAAKTKTKTATRKRK